MPKVSAVIPVYGEKNIERCVRSLLDQTLDDIEFIFVDDRSPDSAYEIVLGIIAEERYASLKDSIKIVRHDKNRGVAAVRRTGWEASSGDYVYHADSDDWLHPDMLRRLWEKAVEGDYDIVECDYMETDGLGDFKRRVPYVLYKQCEDWIPHLGTASLSNKIVKRSVYENEIIWPQHPFMEDYVLASQLFCYSASRYYLDEPLYYYYQNPSGMSKTRDKRVIVEGYLKQGKILEDFFRSKGLYRKYRTRLTVYKSSAMVHAWNLPRNEFLKVFPEDRLRVLTCSAVPLKERLGILTKLLGIHGIRGKKRG